MREPTGTVTVPTPRRKEPIEASVADVALRRPKPDPRDTQRDKEAERWRDAIARFYDQTRPGPRPGRVHYYHKRIRKRLAGIVEPGARVLEVGCGNGDLLASLRPTCGVGVDLSRRLINEACRRHPGLRFICMPGEEVHSLGDTFDYVVICQTLDEVYDLQELFRSIQSVCHARTRLVVVHHNRLWQPALRLMEWLRVKKRSPERNWLPADEISHLLRLSEFESIRMSGMTVAPLPVPLLSELMNRFVGNLPLVHTLGVNDVIVARSVRPGVLESARPKSVSIVVPACNEAGHIRSLLRRIPRLADRQQVIFVEGGSRDQTWNEIQDAVSRYEGAFDVKCMQQQGTGKGDAVRRGFAVATGDCLMILDADMSVPPEELPAFYEALSNGKGEFINGSRMVYMMDKRAMRFLNLMGNKAFGWVFTYLLSQRFRDTLCGTKVLMRSDYERIVANRAYFGDFDPFGDFDLLFGAARLNLKITDVPVHYKARTYGETNISRFRHGWVLLRMCVFAARKLKFI